jgi:dihydroorotase
MRSSRTSTSSNGRLIDPKNGIDERLPTCSSPTGVSRPSASRRPAFAPARQIDASGLIVCPGLVDLSARLGGIEPELARRSPAA